MTAALWAEVIARSHPHLVRHVQVSRNFGRLGGWLRCEFWTYASGDPAGFARSRVEYPVVARGR
jgi:hypothetical protein